MGELPRQKSLSMADAERRESENGFPWPHHATWLQKDFPGPTHQLVSLNGRLLGYSANAINKSNQMKG